MLGTDGSPRLGPAFLLSVALIGAAFFALVGHHMLEQLRAILEAMP